MTDELDFDMDLDVEALAQTLEASGVHPEGSMGPGAAPLHDEPTGPELIEALPSSPARPSESYDPELPNWAVEGTNAQKVPGDGLACVSCPEAVWMTGGADLEAFCRVLRSITWTTRDQSPMQIEICNGKEMAVLALQEAQNGAATKEELKQAAR